MARPRDDRKTGARAPRRVRVPASLAVAVLGASATAAMGIGGCEDGNPPEPVDAGQIMMERRDAGVADGRTLPDGAEPPPPDGDRDAPAPDAPDRPPPDAALPPPDAPDQ